MDSLSVGEWLLRRSKLIFFYLFAEMIPTLFIGLIAFDSILLLAQILKLTDMLIQHGASIRTLIHLFSFMSISFLPAILPMSLIFAVVLSYNRFSADSEIIAMKSLGLSMWPIVIPAFVLGCLVSVLSGYASFKLGPWGNRQMELMMTEIGNTQIISQIQEGTFSGFFNMVVYTNHINKDTEELENVFIYDERDPASPTTIIAEKGKIVSEKSVNALKAFVRLINGDIHKMSETGHTKIHFDTYDLQIVEPTNKKTRDKSIESLTYSDLQYLMKNPKSPTELRSHSYEWHKRFSLSFACILFALLGVGLGCRTHNRTGKSGGGVISVLVIVAYWLLFVVGNSLIKNPSLPVWLGAWLPAFVLLPVSFYLLRRNWN